MEAFPDAKVVLTVRDTSSWYRSVQSTIRQHARLKRNWVNKAIMHIMGKGRVLTVLEKRQRRFSGKKKLLMLVFT